MSLVTVARGRGNLNCDVTEAQELAWNGVAYARIYLTDLQTMNSTQMTSSIYSTDLADYQAAVDLLFFWAHLQQYL